MTAAVARLLYSTLAYFFGHFEKLIDLSGVHTDPGKSRNLKLRFSSPGKPWNQA